MRVVPRAVLSLLLAALMGVMPAAQARGETEVGEESPGTYSGRTTFGYEGRSRQPAGIQRSRDASSSLSLPPTAGDSFMEECLRTQAGEDCVAVAGLGLARSAVDVEALARQVIVRLRLPDPTPRIGPDPEDNEWRMAAVGFPLWLWTDGPRTVRAVETAYGVRFTLRADWVSTTFAMGDGRSRTCTATRPYPASAKPGSASPSCGYTYQRASLPDGSYRVTATTRWRISWSALGLSGTLPGTHAGSRTLRVGEVHSLVVG